MKVVCVCVFLRAGGGKWASGYPEAQMGGENRLCVCVCYQVEKGYVTSKKSHQCLPHVWGESGRNLGVSSLTTNMGKGVSVYLWCFINYSVYPFLLPAFFLSLTDCYECCAPLNNVLFSITALLMNTAWLCRNMFVWEIRARKEVEGEYHKEMFEWCVITKLKEQKCNYNLHISD